MSNWLAWLNALPAGTQELVVGLLVAAIAGVGGLIGKVGSVYLWRGSPATNDAAWRTMETRFDRIDGEVEGIRSTYVSGLVTWSLHGNNEDRRQGAKTGELDRRVQRFKTEAKSAARLWKRQHPKIATAADPVDAWLNIVAASVHSGSSITGSGYDEHGQHETFHIDRLVDASKLMCAALAADAETTA